MIYPYIIYFECNDCSFVDYFSHMEDQLDTWPKCEDSLWSGLQVIDNLHMYILLKAFGKTLQYFIWVQNDFR